MNGFQPDEPSLPMRIARRFLPALAGLGLSSLTVTAALPSLSEDRVLIDHAIEQRGYWCKNALQKKYPKSTRFAMVVRLTPASQLKVNTEALKLQWINRQGLDYAYTVDLAGKRYEGVCSTAGNGKVSRLQQLKVGPVPQSN